MTRDYERPVWGIADLHAHPASYLAFAHPNIQTGETISTTQRTLRSVVLGHPQRLQFSAPGSFLPRNIPDEEYAALGYAAVAGDPPALGHRNRRGINREPIRNLMRQGLMIDLAHMSQVSTAETLTLAEGLHYPVMNSHSGLRSDASPSESERSMLQSHATRLAALGGVLGFGTATDASLASWVAQYRNAFRVLGRRGALTKRKGPQHHVAALALFISAIAVRSSACR